MQKMEQISINLTPERWQKRTIDKNKSFYLFKYMEESNFFDDLEVIKEKKLPYIYIEHNENKKVDFVEASTGLVRAVPIFYKIEEKTLIISDDINKLINRKDKVDYQFLKEFLVFSYVLKNNTLFRDIKQIQAGEMLKCSINETLVLEDYFIYDEGDEFNVEKEKLFGYYEDVLYKTFELYTEKLKNKKIIVPLSGGYDSRLIVTMLKEFGIKDVLCVSYGIENNFESRKASIVAEKLKYDLDIVIYNPKERILLLNDDNYLNYLEYSSQKSSLGHMQEFLMMKYLNEKYNFTKEDVVFIPGHTGDFVSGSHIPYRLLNKSSYDDLKISIFERHGLRNSKNHNLLDNYPFKFKEQYKNIEYFDWRERQSKFIANANRNYDYNGYKWVLPYWFNDYVLFWCEVPLVHKYQKNLYDEYLEEKIFKNYCLDFDKKERIKVRGKKQSFLLSKLKSIAKKSKIVKSLYKKLSKSFSKSYNPLGTDKIIEDMLEKAKEQFSNGYEKLNYIVENEFGYERMGINAYSTEYYLSKVLEEFEVDEL